MKNFLKRINRGVVLALICTIALIFIIIGDLKYVSKEEDKVISVLNSYVDEMAKAMIAPDNLREIGKTHSKEDYLEQENALKNVIDKYWVDYKPSVDQYNLFNKSAAKKEIELYLDSIYKTTTLYYEELSYTILDLNMKKVGNEYLSIDFSLMPKRTMHVNSNELYLDFNPFILDMIDRYSSYTMEPEKDPNGDNINDETITTNFWDRLVHIEMQKINDEWKIIFSSLNYN